MNIIQNICKKLGKENNALYAVVTVAIFKSVSRPIFTMLDKKQDHKSKKYAALRECATELIAIPTYIAVAKASEKLAPMLHSNKVKGARLEATKTGLGFIGVCLAGSVIVPALCNLVMPILFKKNTNDKKNTSQNVSIAATSKININSKDSIYNNVYPNRTNFVGGLKI